MKYRYFRYTVTNGDEYIARAEKGLGGYEYKCVHRANGKRFAFDNDDSWISNPGTPDYESSIKLLENFGTEMTDEEIFEEEL